MQDTFLKNNSLSPKQSKTKMIIVFKTFFYDTA